MGGRERDGREDGREREGGREDGRERGREDGREREGGKVRENGGRSKVVTGEESRGGREEEGAEEKAMEEKRWEEKRLVNSVKVSASTTHSASRVPLGLAVMEQRTCIEDIFRLRRWNACNSNVWMCTRAVALLTLAFAAAKPPTVNCENTGKHAQVESCTTSSS